MNSRTIRQKAKTLVATAVLLVGVAVPTLSNAQWIVFDPTSYIQSAITAMESMAGTAQRAQAYVAQLQQYQTMLINLKQLPQGALNNALGSLNQGQSELVKNMGGLEKIRDIGSISNEIGRVSGSITNAKSSVSSLIALQQSMGGLQESFSKRFEEARRLNLTWEQYAAQEDLQIRSRVASAASRAQEDISRVERVKRDYEFAQEMAQKIPEAEGVQQSMAIMNTQMNRVVTQLAEVNKGLTSAMNSKSPEDVAAEEQAKQRAADDKRTRIRNAEIQRSADREVFKTWK
jgi:conjugal transfer/entry exclusion protein